jgi:hypothetical protein
VVHHLRITNPKGARAAYISSLYYEAPETVGRAALLSQRGAVWGVKFSWPAAQVAGEGPFAETWLLLCSFPLMPFPDFPKWHPPVFSGLLCSAPSAGALISPRALVGGITSCSGIYWRAACALRFARCEVRWRCSALTRNHTPPPRFWGGGVQLPFIYSRNSHRRRVDRTGGFAFAIAPCDMQ